MVPAGTATMTAIAAGPVGLGISRRAPVPGAVVDNPGGDI